MGQARREPCHWVEDATWHRRMFAESMFRWVPEDPMAIVLCYTRGRLLFETPGDLRFLDQRGLAVRDFAGRIDDIMARHIREGFRVAGESIANDCLAVIDVSPRQAAQLEFAAQPISSRFREAERVVEGIPLPNPFTLVWELRQLRSMYTAVDDMIEDAYCDLAQELHDAGRTWQQIAQVSPTCYGDVNQVRARIAEQRRLRGESGDPRRSPEHRY